MASSVEGEGLHDTPVAEGSPAAEDEQQILTYGVLVRDLPHNIMPSQLAHELQRFGGFKQNSIRVKAKENLCCAYAEFEHISGRQKAIESSPISVGIHASYVEEATIDYWEIYMEAAETITKTVTPGVNKHKRILKKEKKLRDSGQANGGGPASSLQQKQHIPPPQSSLNRTLNSPLPHQMSSPAVQGGHCQSFAPSSNLPQTSTTVAQGPRNQSFGQNKPRTPIPAARGRRRRSFGPS